jgi:membrane-bound lytic murein transglycosylase MltF
LFTIKIFFFEKSEEQNPVQVPVSWQLILRKLKNRNISMDNENYNNLYMVLTDQPLPDTIPLPQQQQLRKQSKHFIIKNNFIYKKDKRKDNNLLRLIRRFEVGPVLYMFHNDPTSAHFAADAIFEKI